MGGKSDWTNLQECAEYRHWGLQGREGQREPQREGSGGPSQCLLLGIFLSIKGVSEAIPLGPTPHSWPLTSPPHKSSCGQQDGHVQCLTVRLVDQVARTF